MSPKKIVITGAPGTGKTVVIKALENQGYHCYHEIIRDMTAQAKKMGTAKEMVSNPLAFVDDPLEFNRALIHGRTAHYKDALTCSKPICFFDRGIPDVLAYMDYFEQQYPSTFATLSQNKRYDRIFILPPWKDIYTSDNERLESFEEAEKLHLHLTATYKKYGYRPIRVPKAPIEERTSFVLQNIH